MEIRTAQKRVMLLLLLGALLRLAFLQLDGYSTDEIFSLSTARGIPENLFVENQPVSVGQLQDRHTLRDFYLANQFNDSGNSILYHGVLFLVHQITDSTLWIRSLGILFFIVNGLLFYRIARNFLSALFAALALLILAVHPFLIEFDLTIRAYSFSLIFILLQIHLFFRILQGDSSRKTVLLFTLASLLAFFSHFLTIYILFFNVLFFICTQGRRWKELLLPGFLFAGVLIAFYLINREGWFWMSHRNQILVDLAAADPSKKASVRNLFIENTAAFFRMSGIHAEMANLRFRNLVICIVPTVAILVAGLWIYRKKQMRQPLLTYLLLLVIFPFAVYTLTGFSAGHTFTFQPRYFIWYMPFFILLTVYCATLLPHVGKWALGLLLIVPMLFSDIQYYRKAKRFSDRIHAQHARIDKDLKDARRVDFKHTYYLLYVLTDFELKPDMQINYIGNETDNRGFEARQFQVYTTRGKHTYYGHEGFRISLPADPRP